MGGNTLPYVCPITIVILSTLPLAANYTSTDALERANVLMLQYQYVVFSEEHCRRFEFVLQKWFVVWRRAIHCSSLDTFLPITQIAFPLARYWIQCRQVTGDGHKYIKMYFQMKYQIPTLKLHQNKLQNSRKKRKKNASQMYQNGIFEFSKYYKILLSQRQFVKQPFSNS